MFFAHLPAGYLIGRALMRHAPRTSDTWILTAAMVGGLFPDLDLLYLYLLDASPQHHHTYWTHLPLAWLGGTLVAAAAARQREKGFKLALASFLLGWASHLLLDTLAGQIWWLYPLSDRPFSLAQAENRFQPWGMNFILHWTMAFEIAIIAAAAGVETRSPLVFTRIRLGRPVAAFGLLMAALMLFEAYRPAPALAQPVPGASQTGRG